MFSFGGFLQEHTKNHADGSPHGGPPKTHHAAGLIHLASLTLANEAHLDDLLAGYGTSVDVDMIRAWWSWRCLVVIRWLYENGYGDPQTFPEVAVLRSQA